MVQKANTAIEMAKIKEQGATRINTITRHVNLIHKLLHEESCQSEDNPNEQKKPP